MSSVLIFWRTFWEPAGAVAALGLALAGGSRLIFAPDAWVLP
jgi:hypothetical protein